MCTLYLLLFMNFLSEELLTHFHSILCFNNSMYAVHFVCLLFHILMSFWQTSGFVVCSCICLYV